MLFTYKPHKSLSIPPTLGIETECSTSSARFKSRDEIPWLTQLKSYKGTSKFLATHLAIFRPLKNFAMSWSDDCHGNPLARITALSSTSSILLLQAQKVVNAETSATHQPACLPFVLQEKASVPAPYLLDGNAKAVRPKCHQLKVTVQVSPRERLLCKVSPFQIPLSLWVLFHHIPNLLPSPDIICASVIWRRLPA